MIQMTEGCYPNFCLFFSPLSRAWLSWLLVTMASSAGVPLHGEYLEQVEPSAAHPQFRKNLNLGQKLFQFFGL
jgi:hypothetical protein